MSIRTGNVPLRPARATSAFDPNRVRDDFPILRQTVRGRPLIYLDNAATAQKPQAVLDALHRYYTEANANVHRAAHELSERSTHLYENARATVKRFLNAAATREIIFGRGTTDAINLVAQSYGRQNFQPGDEILITCMEHHSNIVPWQMVCEQTGAVLRVVPINDRGELLLDEFEKLLGPRTKLVALTQVSNALGTINPVRSMIARAHAQGVPVLVDGAQAVSHFPVDVQDLDCDFYVFSGHKLYGPTGIGVLYGKTALLNAMPPNQGGGDMISSVTFEKTTYNDLPYKFEAGTPNIAGVVGLAAAIDYLAELDRNEVAAHEQALLRHAAERLSAIRGVRLIGTAAQRTGALSFVVDEPPLAALDIGSRLDLDGIAVRTGHHCCQPLMERFGIPGTVRASFALYNTFEEIDAFIAALKKIVTEGGIAAKSAVAVPVSPRSEPVYPPAFAASPQAVADQLASDFEFIEDWTERYEYIIELGRKLPAMPAELKSDDNRVRGCQSTVHLSLRRRPGDAGIVEFLADSDADIVRGLIAILQRLFSGQRAEQVVAFDIEGFFVRLGLDTNLTLGRRNGLAAMVQRIRQFARSTP